MAYPTSTPYAFATNSGRRQTPTTARQQSGWNAGDPLPELIANDLWGVLSDWSLYVSTQSSADGIWDSVTQVGSTSAATTILGTGATIRGGNTDTTKVSLTVNDDSLIFGYNVSVPESLLSWAPSFSWYMQNDGLVVAGGTRDDAYRYGYSSSTVGATRLSIEYPLADTSGGWGLESPAVTKAFPTCDANGALTIYNDSGGATAIDIARDLSFIGDNAAAGAATHRLVSVKIGAATPVATDQITVTVERRARGTSTVTPLGTYSTTTAATNQTIAINHDMDVGANAYRVIVTLANVGAGAVGGTVRDLTAVIEKYAVE